jgi:hypothetical protein
MAAPQVENMDSLSNKQHQHQTFFWHNSFSAHTIDSQEIDIFTKAWIRRNENTPVGTRSFASSASLHVSSPFWLQRDNFIHTDKLGFTPIASAAALLSLHEKGLYPKKNQPPNAQTKTLLTFFPIFIFILDHQSKRNILLTKVPMANHLAIKEFIKVFTFTLWNTKSF